LGPDGGRENEGSREEGEGRFHERVAGERDAMPDGRVRCRTGEMVTRESAPVQCGSAWGTVTRRMRG
jgi:hypothetical protein